MIKALWEIEREGKERGREIKKRQLMGPQHNT